MAIKGFTNAFVSPGLAQSIKIGNSALRGHLKLIELLIGILAGNSYCVRTRKETTPIEGQVATALLAILYSVGSSVRTLLELLKTTGVHVQDCYSIARSIIEGVINICFILAEGPPIAARALRHARQKAYRNLERESKIGSSVIKLVYSGKKDISSIPGLKKEIEEFTSRVGREKGWTDLSVDDRIAAVGEKLDGSLLEYLHLSRFMIYRDSSEILHATVFGAMDFMGLFEHSRSKSANERVEKIGERQMIILLAMHLAISTMIKAFHLKYGYAYAKKRSLAQWKRFSKAPFFKKGKSD